MIHHRKCCLLLVFLSTQFVVGNAAYAQLQLEQGINVTAMLEALFGGGVQIERLSTTCDTTLAMAKFSDGGPIMGLREGVMISTGNVHQGSSNSSTEAAHLLASTSLDGVGHAGLSGLLNGVATFDACVIEFDLIPHCDTLAISYVFASEEYLDYVGSAFNDAFAFFISGPGFEGVHNMAHVPGTEVPVSINNVNPQSHASHYVDNYQGTRLTYNGYTRPLLAKARVQPCASYHVAIALADVSDDILDSAVFLEAGGIGCLQPFPRLEAMAGPQGGAQAIEGCLNGRFQFRLDQAAATDQVFHFQLAGSARPGEDFLPFPDSVLIPAGDSLAEIMVSLLEDDVREGQEFLQLVYVDASQCAQAPYTDTATLYFRDALEQDSLPDLIHCSGTELILGRTAIPGYTYRWHPTALVPQPDLAQPRLQLPPLNADTSVSLVLEVTAGQGGCRFQDSFQVHVFPPPGVILNPDSACLGSPLAFRPVVHGPPPVRWRWEFGDGQKDTLARPSHTYASAGTYEVQLEVWSRQGCRGQDSSRVHVHHLPTPQVSIPSLCEGVMGQFEGTTTAWDPAWHWDFGDGSNSPEASPTHRYETAGDYLLTAWTQSVAGCTDSLQQWVRVHAPPQVALELDDGCSQVALSPQLTQVSGAPIEAYTWNFGDGHQSDEAQPSHTYQHHGTYELQVEVTDTAGCVGAALQLLRIHPTPSLSFSWEPSCEGSPMTFTNTSQGGGNRYHWSFGDGQSSTQPHPEHVFDVPGPHLVQLTLAGSSCRDTFEAEVLVYSRPQLGIAADSACVGEAVQLRPLIHWPAGADSSSIQAYAWDFGDGTQAYDQMPTHVYDSPRPHALRLSVRTGEGCVSTFRHTYEVHPLPDLSVLPSSPVCPGSSSRLAVHSSSPAARVQWYAHAQDSLPLATGEAFVSPPLYSTGLYYATATSEAGCRSARLPVSAPVYELHGRILLPDSVLYLPQAVVSPSYQGSAPLAQWTWDLGDGTQSSLEAPVHAYRHAGTYSLLLRGYDANGCQVALSRTVEVKRRPYLWVPTAFSPNGDGHNDRWEVQVQGLQHLQYWVFNRWGQLVFQGRSHSLAWDGTWEGTPLPQGVYVYRILGVAPDGLRIDERGSLSLIR